MFALRAQQALEASRELDVASADDLEGALVVAFADRVDPVDAVDDLDRREAEEEQHQENVSQRSHPTSVAVPRRERQRGIGRDASAELRDEGGFAARGIRFCHGRPKAGNADDADCADWRRLARSFVQLASDVERDPQARRTDG